jgi:hypothetical protein
MTNPTNEEANKIEEWAWLHKEADSLAADSGVLNIFSYAEGVQDESKSRAQETLSVELALANSLIAIGAWFAMALHANKADQRFFPPDWLEPTGKVNPDIILSCMLCQLTNYGHAVVSLVNKGIDTPARALVRATAELSYMLAVVVSDRETFQKYVLDSSVSQKEQWYLLFSNRKIAARMLRVDTAIGLPQEWTIAFRGFREQNGEFFSEAVHHSYRAMVCGALPSNPDNDRLELAVLGGIPSASRATLSYLIESLNYGLTMLIASVNLRAEWTPSFALSNFWESGKQLLQQIQPVFLAWLKIREHDHARANMTEDEICEADIENET